MDFNKMFQSQTFKIILIVIGALIIALLIFKAGVFVGYKKAGFSYRWGENYHKNFAGPKGGFLDEFKKGFGDKEFIDAHGTFGTIIKIDGDTIVLKGKDNVEKTVLVTDKTVINRAKETIKISDLKADDQIVIIGSPNEQGQIEAKLIRVFNKEMMKNFPFKAPSHYPFS